MKTEPGQQIFPHLCSWGALYPQVSFPPHHLQLKFCLFVISRVFSSDTPTHSALISSCKTDIMDQGVPWKIIPFFSSGFKEWQDIAFDVLWLMKIAGNGGQVLSLTCKCPWLLPNSLLQIYNACRARGTAALVNPVMHKCWKMTKLSPFQWVMLTSGFLAVLGEMWSSNIHHFRGLAAICYQGLDNKNSKCCCTPYKRPKQGIVPPNYSPGKFRFLPQGQINGLCDIFLLRN